MTITYNGSQWHFVAVYLVEVYGAVTLVMPDPQMYSFHITVTTETRLNAIKNELSRVLANWLTDQRVYGLTS